MRIKAVSLLSVSLLLGATPTIAATSSTPEASLVDSVKNGPLQKIGPWLGNLYNEFQQSPNKSAFTTTNPVVKVNGGKVGVDMYANDPASLRSSLASFGAENIKANGPLISAQVPVSALGKLAALSSLEYADAVLAITRAASQGKVVSQGDAAMNADVARANSGLDGTGVTVGVMSDSYGCNPPAFVPGAPNSTAAQDAATHDVAANVQVLEDLCPGTDEGRAMAQLVHDVAPGAGEKFHTAFNGQLDLAQGILDLQKAGSNVLVDDVIYFAENMFSDGIIAQAADAAVKKGAAYFSSAGNDARHSYESAYHEITVTSPASGNLNGNGDPAVLHVHDFGGGDTLQKIHVTQSGGQAVILFSFQWDQPFLSSTTYAQLTDPNGGSPKGATGDMDMLIYDDTGTLVPLCPPGVARGITCQLAGTRNIGRDAVDIGVLVVTGPKSKSGDFFVRFVRAGGAAPQHVKYVYFELAGSMQIVTHDTKSGAAYGHANAHNVAGVGASSWYLTPRFDSYFSALVQDTPGACNPGACLNDFSSAGGVPIYLDKYGNTLATAAVRETPRFTGPDGGNTTFFFADSSFDDDDGDGCNSPTSKFITPCLDNPADELPNFFGTSASAPHVAGVAALMLDKNSGLTSQQIYSILSSTSHDMTKREVQIVPACNGANASVCGPGNSIFSPLPAGYDFDSGHGFVDAAAAVAATPLP
ncbi:MAG TPA: S8 family serine peptidase [Terriglobales bacterium]